MAVDVIGNVSRQSGHVFDAFRNTDPMQATTLCTRTDISRKLFWKHGVGPFVSTLQHQQGECFELLIHLTTPTQCEIDPSQKAVFLLCDRDRTHTVAVFRNRHRFHKFLALIVQEA